MKSVLIRAAGAALLAIAVTPASPAAAASGWTAPVRISAPAPDANNSLLTADQTGDAAGNVHVAYSYCVPGSCSLFVTTRDAATGDWTEPDEVSAPTNANEVTGPNAIDIEANAAGDLAVVWQTCQFVSSSCAPRLALRPAALQEWTAPEPLAPSVYSAHEHVHHQFGPDVAVAPDGSATVAWSLRHADGGIQPGETLVRTARVSDPGAPHPALQFDGSPELVSQTGMHAPDNAEVAIAGDGTTVAAWWHYAGGGCSTIAFAVRPSAGAWGAPQGVDGPICDPGSLAMDNPSVAAYGAASDVVLAWSTSVWGDPSSGTTVASVDSDGAVERRHKLSDHRAGLHADVTSGGHDHARAQFSENVHGEVAFGFSEIDPSLGQDRPVVVVRDATGTWGEPVGVDGYTSNNVNPNPAPGVALDDDGTTLVAYTARVPVEGSMFFNPEVRVAKLPRSASTPLPAVKLSRDAADSDRPLLTRGPAGTPVAVWRRAHADLSHTVSLDASELWSGPQASFTYAPATPVAGEPVTFTSTSTDPDEATAALGHAWDFDGDGDFTDATGSPAIATFPVAGDYDVELLVTDADDQVDYVTRTVTVGAAPPADPPSDPPSHPGAGPGTGSGPGSGPGHVPPSDDPPANEPAPAPLPAGFVVTRNIDTNGARTMPAVAGRALDDARARTIRALVHADVKLTPRSGDASKLGKRPGGGKWKTGDVISQQPAAGAKMSTGAANPAAVALTYWSGAKSGKKKCDELRAAVKGDDLDLALAQLKAAKCGAPDLKLTASKKASEPTVKSLSKDRKDMTVTVPTDQSKTDIVIWKNTGFLGTNDPGPVPSAQGDLQLTAGQQNVAGVILRDRAGQPLNRASVTWDLSGVGGAEKTTKSIESGVAPVKLTPEKAGTVRVLVSWSDSVGETIYGYTEFKVVDRSKEPGFITAIGQSFKRVGSGKTATFKPGTFKSKSGKRASIGGFFDLVAQCIRSWGGAVGSAVNASAEGVLGVAKQYGASVAQLWRGPVTGAPQAAQPKFTTAGMWLVHPSGVVSAGGANVVAAGGMNVVAAGGANVVAAGGLNLLGPAGGNVVSAGGGNIITLPDGAKVVSAGGGNVVAAGGMNVIAAGGGNVVAAGGLN